MVHTHGTAHSAQVQPKSRTALGCAHGSRSGIWVQVQEVIPSFSPQEGHLYGEHVEELGNRQYNAVYRALVHTNIVEYVISVNINVISIWIGTQQVFTSEQAAVGTFSLKKGTPLLRTCVLGSPSPVYG